MIRGILFGCLGALVAAFALAGNSVSAKEAAAAEVVALGGRCVQDAAGATIGVDLSNAWLTDADLAKLAKLPKLESINLSYTKITDQGLEHLAPLTNVRSLNLYYAESVSDEGIAHLKHWRTLERLNLRGTKVTSTLFEHIAPMTSLKFLDVGFSRVNDDSFELLEGLVHLERFEFGGNKMSGVALPTLKSLPALRELNVSGRQRTDSGLWSVAVTDFNIGQIAQLSRLEVLDLGETNVSDRGVAELARLKHLRSLDLSGTRVTGKGLAALEGLPELRRLRLWKTAGIDDAAIPEIVKLHRLEVLELPETRVTAKGLEALAALKGLKRLYIGGVSVAPEQVESIRSALPGRLVSWWKQPEIPTSERRRFGN